MERSLIPIFYPGVRLLAFHSSWHHGQTAGLEFASSCFDLPIQNSPYWQVQGLSSSSAINICVVLLEKRLPKPPSTNYEATCELMLIPDNICAKKCIIWCHVKPPGRTLAAKEVTPEAVLTWNRLRWDDKYSHCPSATTPLHAHLLQGAVLNAKGCLQAEMTSASTERS